MYCVVVDCLVVVVGVECEWIGVVVDLFVGLE